MSLIRFLALASLSNAMSRVQIVSESKENHKPKRRPLKERLERNKRRKQSR